MARKYRSKMSRKGSKKSFSRSAAHTHVKNLAGYSMRGGIRL